MEKDYFRETKENLEKKIPSYDSDKFGKIRSQIRKKLQEREADFYVLLRNLKVLVLGDWYTKEKKQLLHSVKNHLLKNGVYAETIDKYYDTEKKGGLSQLQVLETCCISHQLIVFIDGDGKGTVTEQNYLSENYVFQGKIIFFIEQRKFDKLKANPSEYIKCFPAIYPYTSSELLDKILIYSNLRLYRLAEIIEHQNRTKKGLKRQNYTSWRTRLKNS
ncbi:MAG: hypothetical protein CL944_00370 [Candidatus Diapherotrites archaeon]|uniref:DUF4062 domain-containing protein n=1 Tax=Candidatus Iainarchaeum sp. TaxID=3101447 RepID=A0A2D6LP10_9ARCH|nr:hypothetical protein [Candidatus Diapherotrites archaeon]|tara:strand:+ start:14299 stop:14952 length:654 start_codon:yes stop_codon:yes gene_type:complete